jgi:signal recognition particle GTPase
VILKFFRRKSQPDVQMEQGLEKTRRGVFLEITRLFERGALDDELYEELEMLLIQADVGWDVSQNSLPICSGACARSASRTRCWPAKSCARR